MDEYQKCAEWKKPYTKEYIVYEQIIESAGTSRENFIHSWKKVKIVVTSESSHERKMTGKENVKTFLGWWQYPIL